MAGKVLVKMGSGGPTVQAVTGLCPSYTNGLLSGLTVERTPLALPPGAIVGSPVCLTAQASRCCLPPETVCGCTLPGLLWLTLVNVYACDGTSGSGNQAVAPGINWPLAAGGGRSWVSYPMTYNTASRWWSTGSVQFTSGAVPNFYEWRLSCGCPTAGQGAGPGTYVLSGVASDANGNSDALFNNGTLSCVIAHNPAVAYPHGCAMPRDPFGNTGWIVGKFIDGSGGSNLLADSFYRNPAIACSNPPPWPGNTGDHWCGGLYQALVTLGPPAKIVSPLLPGADASDGANTPPMWLTCSVSSAPGRPGLTSFIAGLYLTATGVWKGSGTDPVTGEQISLTLTFVAANSWTLKAQWSGRTGGATAAGSTSGAYQPMGTYNVPTSTAGTVQFTVGQMG